MCRLTTEVKAAQEEANENATLLKPMRQLFEKLRDLDDFAVIPTLFRPILHLLLLIWTHGRHYNTATRFVTLMRLVCNEVLQQARRFAPGASPSTLPSPVAGLAPSGASVHEVTPGCLGTVAPSSPAGRELELGGSCCMTLPHASARVLHLPAGSERG